MIKKTTTIILFITVSAMFAPLYAQSGKGPGLAFEKPVLTDSNSTLMLPVRYNFDLLASNKMALSGNDYANIIFYNFKTDTYKRLFETNTHIEWALQPIKYNYRESEAYKPQGPYLFYFVRNIDRNQNERIDSRDPAILYVSDVHGDQLKALSTANENVESIEIYEKQQFALVKFQRDADNDGDYEYEDRDYYYIKLDLNTLTFGQKIEIK